jgi:hypothetical protein
MQIGYDENKPLDPIDLTEWSKDWLQTKGVNKLSCTYEKDGNKFKNLKIKQTHCSHSD